MKFVWITVCLVEFEEYTELDRPQVFAHKKDAKAWFVKKVKWLFDEMVDEEDLVNRVEGDLYLHISCNYGREYATIYTKKVKVR